MTSHPSLFDAPATRGAARKTDPATSRAAAAAMSGHVLAHAQAEVLRLLAEIVGPGIEWKATAPQIVDHAIARHGRRLQQNVVVKRLGELKERGLVRVDGTRPGPTGRPCMCFALTDKGRAWLEGDR